MRARNIKPGFFQNEHLVELEPQVRLLFIGLWLMADRDGRLEDRPKKIKMQVFPADSWDVDSMLQELSEQDLIVRYKVDSKRYIFIPAWGKHQNPHVKEKASTIPAPDSHGATPEITETDPADSLNPDSLNPDSLNPEKKRGAKRAPKDFKLTEKLVAYAKEKGMDDTTIAEQFEGFMDWEFKSARKDWPACWRTWCRRWKEMNPGKVTTPLKHRTPDVPTEEQLRQDRAKADRELKALAAR